jgi:hypothetical protein
VPARASYVIILNTSGLERVTATIPADVRTAADREALEEIQRLRAGER